MPLTCHVVSLALSGEALAAGRILLSVKEYTVNNAVSPERFQAEFWAEVAKLVEAGNGGSSMMVAPNFMLDDFKGFQSFFNLQVDHLTPSPRRSLCPHVALCVCVCVCLCVFVCVHAGGKCGWLTEENNSWSSLWPSGLERAKTSASPRFILRLPCVPVHAPARPVELLILNP
jgi:hypothetical protein